MMEGWEYHVWGGNKTGKVRRLLVGGKGSGLVKRFELKDL